jgi:hypothetical protein
MFPWVLMTSPTRIGIEVLGLNSGVPAVWRGPGRGPNRAGVLPDVRLSAIPTEGPGPRIINSVAWRRTCPVNPPKRWLSILNNEQFFTAMKEPNYLFPLALLYSRATQAVPLVP